MPSPVDGIHIVEVVRTLQIEPVLQEATIFKGMHTLSPVTELLKCSLLKNVAVPFVGTLLLTGPADRRGNGKRCDSLVRIEELRGCGEAHSIVGS